MTLSRDFLLADEPPAQRQHGLLAIEKLCLTYSVLTTLLLFVLWPRMHHPAEMLMGRTAIAAGTLLLWAAYRRFPCRLMVFARITAQMSLLNYWYPDTYEFNRLFPNLDYLFASWEQQLFGGQPAVWFSQACPGTLFSEAFNLGYFSYYPMVLILMVFYFFRRYRHYQEASFVIMASFFIYYVIYIFLPVAGPQFYFEAIGMDSVQAADFPALGTYFSHHTDMLPAPGNADGIFYNLVKSTQDMGERPTAAFPSSHIGITAIMLILAFRAERRLGYALLPLSLLLCCATVYIQAHYLIDAIAGLLSAVPVYLLALTLYRRVYRKLPE